MRKSSEKNHFWTLDPVTENRTSPVLSNFHLELCGFFWWFPSWLCFHQFQVTIRLSLPFGKRRRSWAIISHRRRKAFWIVEPLTQLGAKHLLLNSKWQHLFSIVYILFGKYMEVYGCCVFLMLCWSSWTAKNHLDLAAATSGSVQPLHNAGPSRLPLGGKTAPFVLGFVLGLPRMTKCRGVLEQCPGHQKPGGNGFAMFCWAILDTLLTLFKWNPQNKFNVSHAGPCRLLYSSKLTFAECAH